MQMLLSMMPPHTSRNSYTAVLFARACPRFLCGWPDDADAWSACRCVPTGLSCVTPCAVPRPPRPVVVPRFPLAPGFLPRPALSESVTDVPAGDVFPSFSTRACSASSSRVSGACGRRCPYPIPLIALSSPATLIPNARVIPVAPSCLHRS
jgi:hypothetical protein